MSDKKVAKRAMIIVIVIAVVIITTLVGVIVYMVKNGGGEEETKKRPVLISEDNVEEMLEEVVNREEPQGIPLTYQVTMNSTWDFDDGSKASKNAYVANSVETKRQFTLML